MACGGGSSSSGNKKKKKTKKPEKSLALKLKLIMTATSLHFTAPTKRWLQ